MRVFATIVAIVLLIAAVIFGYFWNLQRAVQQLEVASSTVHILAWPDGTTLDTRLGAITGLSNGRVHAFLGIRYGKAPSGEHRFMPPRPADPWSDVLDATKFGKRAWQKTQTATETNDVAQMSEDSLVLNIFTPATEANPRPVLFWIHGGAYTTGSGEYDGSVLAQQGDVVVVTVNYRLGILGFLDLSSYGYEFTGSHANGIRDQILALNWVRDNIADYGGDPGNVTIFGESAGGGSVMSILAAPSADGLYHRAISHSGPSVLAVPQKKDDWRQRLADQLSIEVTDLATTLKSLPANEIINAQDGANYRTGRAVDGTVVTRTPEQALIERGTNGVPLIAGSNRDEGNFFSRMMPPMMYDMMARGMVPPTAGVSGDEYVNQLAEAYPQDSSKQRIERMLNEVFHRPATNLAVRASAAGPGGWLYRFDLPSLLPDLGAAHALEIAFTFNNFAGGAPDDAFLYDRNDPQVRKLALDWSNTIIRFARSGDPNGAGLPPWPRYTAETRQAMILDAVPRIDANIYLQERTRWGHMESSSAELRQP